MERFVNRDEELALIEDAIDTLLDKRRLLRTPIIEFYGVEGIGKTTLLKKVEERCHAQHLPYIWADAQQSTSNHFIRVTKELLEAKGTAVAILDSLDAANEEQLHRFEADLRELIDNNKLLVVLASRRIERFDNVRSVARKLTAFHLKPLDRVNCKFYLDSIGKITPEMRDIILNWTRGYPIAMDVMTEAILHKKLDPRSEQGQKKILSLLSEKVINQNLFSKVTSSELLKYQTLLSLLSVPRRFNLVIMQDIIEEYAKDYKLASSLAYITLPNTINQITNALSWSLLREGYCIDAPVRNIFLLKLKIEDKDRYFAINEFLAQINKRFAQELTGSDRVRYLREYCYHLANSGDATNLPSLLTEQLELIQENFFESFLQFYEELSQDEELKEALGEQNINLIISYIRRKFVEKYIRNTEMSVSERVRLLSEFFLHTTHDPKGNDFPYIFEQGMRQLIQEESPEVPIMLYAELLQDEELRALLGKNYDRVASLVYERLSEER